MELVAIPHSYGSRIIEEATEMFEGTDIEMTTEGQKILGAALGTTTFVEEYVTMKVEKWVEEILALAKITKMYPQAAHAAFSHVIMGKWKYIMRTIEEVSKGSSQNIFKQLSSIVDHENISVSKTVREQHGKDESHHSILAPEFVVWPTSTQQVSEIAAVCYKNCVPMIPFGTGTGIEGGVGAVKGGVCIDLSKMDKIVDVNPADMDVTVEPGVSREHLNTYLRDSGLWFPVDPGADASLCGMAATSASGTNAVRYGTMKQNVINLEVVLPNGKIIHTAGEGRRTRKTSAGYNITNLFVGSEGTLGIITKAILRLYGIPETVVSAVCSFNTIKSAVDAVVEIMGCGIPVARIELLDEVTMDACNIYSDLDYRVAPTLFLEFHGGESDVECQANTTGDIILSNNGSDFIWSKEPAEIKKLWKARHNAWYATLALRPGSVGFATDVCVPISKLPEAIAKAKEEIEKLSLMAPIVGHVGDGNFHLLIIVDPNNSEEQERATELSHRVARHALSLNGTCTGEHGIGRAKMNLLEEEIGRTGIEVMKEIKKTLDPLNIMNPGKVLNM